MAMIRLGAVDAAFRTVVLLALQLLDQRRSFCNSIFICASEPCAAASWITFFISYGSLRRS